MGADVGEAGVDAGDAVGSPGHPHVVAARACTARQISAVVPMFRVNAWNSAHVKAIPPSRVIVLLGLPRVGLSIGKAFRQILQGRIGSFVGAGVGSGGYNQR